MEKGLDIGATSLLGTCASLQDQQVNIHLLCLPVIFWLYEFLQVQGLNCRRGIPASSGIELEMRYNDFLSYQELIQNTLS